MGEVKAGSAKSTVLLIPAVAAGQYSLALHAIREMWKTREAELFELKVGPRLDPLRELPSFRKLRTWSGNNPPRIKSGKAAQNAVMRGRALLPLHHPSPQRFYRRIFAIYVIRSHRVDLAQATRNGALQIENETLEPFIRLILARHR